MIDYYRANRYCGENISLIENYDKASKDLLEVWDLHHRKEEEGYSKQELKDLKMYYERPASELIFLTHAEHTSLHNKGNKYHLGKKHSEEAKKKISEAKTGDKHPMFGRTGEKNPTSKPIHQIDKQTGEIIKTWPCAREVQRVINISFRNISQCCSGKRKSCGGFFWKYAD